MICYPMGLPAWDPMRLIIDGSDDGPASVRCLLWSMRMQRISLISVLAWHVFTSLCLQYGTDDLDAASASLWFAGKMMIPENKLSAHTGRHENTKAIVKLQKKGQGAPSREPVNFFWRSCISLVSIELTNALGLAGSGQSHTTGNAGMAQEKARGTREIKGKSRRLLSQFWVGQQQISEVSLCWSVRRSVQVVRVQPLMLCPEENLITCHMSFGKNSGGAAVCNIFVLIACCLKPCKSMLTQAVELCGICAWVKK